MTLEHVLPESAARLPDWPTFTPEQHGSLRQNIGNLTLLRKTRNERTGNGPFTMKVKACAASVLQVISTIPPYGTWTSGAVEKRAEWLEEYAVKTWPLIAPPPK